MRAPIPRHPVPAALLLAAALAAAGAPSACARGAVAWRADARAEEAPDPGPRGGYLLEADPVCDTLLTRLEAGPSWRGRLHDRADLSAFCDRIGAALALEGMAAGRIRLTLLPAPGSGVGRARIELRDAPARAARLGVVVTGAPFEAARAAALVARGARGGSTPRALRAGVQALREEAVRRGHADAVTGLDSLVLRGDSAIAHVSMRPGPVVRVETLALEGATATRPGAARNIAGLGRRTVLTPAALSSARERLRGSGLFESVGIPRVAAGSAPGLAQVTIPVQELRASRFEGAVGVQQGAGVTGLIDLALGNIAGSGRSLGARWRGIGNGRSEYAARFREPALLGRPVDGALGLTGSIADSLYTLTGWDLRLGLRLRPHARASVGVERAGAAYTGAARGESGTWVVTGGVEWNALYPAGNPSRGASARIAASGGRRTERVPGFEDERRGLVRASLAASGAVPLGASRALFASARAERTTLRGAGGFPAEELRFLGGSEGLRGHADRAYGGDRVLAASLEHRWLGGEESRTYLFVDAGYHSLDAPLEAGGTIFSGATDPGMTDGGATQVAGAAGASVRPSALARTRLSPGWEFGYGAGLTTRLASGSVGIEIGLAPGTPVREAKLHLRYASHW